MISISPISSASGASKYYLEDEKHLTEKEESIEHENGENKKESIEHENGENKKEGTEAYYLSDSKSTEWFGGLANEKGIDGKEIDEKTLTNVLSGNLLDEELHGKRENHRAGFDLTFSAPKSVSILALAGGDKRLLGA